jgi:hypothetical protein
MEYQLEHWSDESVGHIYEAEMVPTNVRTHLFHLMVPLCMVVFYIASGIVHCCLDTGIS